MKNKFLCAFQFWTITVAFPAFAGDFVVPMNESRQVGSYYAIHEDCTSFGKTDVRITTQPQHGSVTVKYLTDYPRFADTNPRHICNTRKVPSTTLWYKPESNFTGSDYIAVDVIYADGHNTQGTVNIQVK
jgi:hypothetical protein